MRSSRAAAWSGSCISAVSVISSSSAPAPRRARASRPRNVVQAAVVDQVARRQVHRRPCSRCPASRQRAQLRQRQVEHQVGERMDGLAQLGQRQEAVRLQQAQARVLPAHQRLEAALAAGRQVELGLVVQASWRSRMAPVELGDHGQALGRVLVERAVVDARARRPCAWPRTWRRRRCAAARGCRRRRPGRRRCPGWRRSAAACLRSGTARAAPPALRRASACARSGVGRRPAAAARTRRRRAGTSTPGSSPSAGRSRGPICCSSLSPTWWPRVSLISLKRSRSSSISAAPGAVRSRPASTCGEFAVQEHAVGQAGEAVVVGQVLQAIDVARARQRQRHRVADRGERIEFDLAEHARLRNSSMMLPSGMSRYSSGETTPDCAPARASASRAAAAAARRGRRSWR